jgi:hypothetical protein
MYVSLKKIPGFRGESVHMHALTPKSGLHHYGKCESIEIDRRKRI